MKSILAFHLDLFSTQIGWSSNWMVFPSDSVDQSINWTDYSLVILIFFSGCHVMLVTNTLTNDNLVHRNFLGKVSGKTYLSKQ